MHYFIILFLALLALPALAKEPQNSCNDPEINQQWEQALTQYPKDRLVLKLAAVRKDLCGMINSGQVDLKTATAIWEQTLTNALLERAREKEARRGLLKLFGTF